MTKAMEREIKKKICKINKGIKVSEEEEKKLKEEKEELVRHLRIIKRKSPAQRLMEEISWLAIRLVKVQVNMNSGSSKRELCGYLIEIRRMIPKIRVKPESWGTLHSVCTDMSTLTVQLENECRALMREFK